MKESELFEPVKTLLLEKVGCDKVYAEVLHHDIVATIGNHDIIVEMKTSLNFRVIEQAVGAKMNGHYVFIAVPYRKGGFSRVVEDFLKYHGIGLIVVREEATFPTPSFYATIPIGMFARLNRRTNNIRRHIKDGYHDQITGGHKMGDFDYQSDYTLMIEDVKRYLQRYPNQWISIDQIIQYCHCYYSKPKPQLTATLKAVWNQEWCEYERIDRKAHFRIKLNNPLKAGETLESHHN